MTSGGLVAVSSFDRLRMTMRARDDNEGRVTPGEAGALFLRVDHPCGRIGGRTACFYDCRNDERQRYAALCRGPLLREGRTDRNDNGARFDDGLLPAPARRRRSLERCAAELLHRRAVAALGTGLFATRPEPCAA